jgi:hypothetical protein
MATHRAERSGAPWARIRAIPDLPEPDPEVVQATREREAAEAAARAAEAALAKAVDDRVAAEARLSELEATLESARAERVLTEPAVDARIWPAHAHRTVHFPAPRGAVVLPVGLGFGALGAAAIAVYAAYRDELTSATGLVCSLVALALVFAVSRLSRPGAVWIEAGQLSVEDGTDVRRFDLSSPETRLSLVGDPAARRWRVLVRDRDTVSDIDSEWVAQPAELLTELRRWRPDL